MKIKFFYKSDCPKCPAAKAVVQKFNDHVEYHNLDEVDGLTEGAYYSVMSTPTTIVVDEQGREVRSWRGSVPDEEELKQLISP